MSRATSRSRRHRRVANAALGSLVAALLGSACVGALAQHKGAVPQPAQGVRSASASTTLESAFWACDHAATSRGLDSGDALACSVATEELKRVRFGGDFGAMLAWWQRSKDAAHRALDAAGLEMARR